MLKLNVWQLNKCRASKLTGWTKLCVMPLGRRSMLLDLAWFLFVVARAHCFGNMEYVGRVNLRPILKLKKLISLIGLGINPWGSTTSGGTWWITNLIGRAIRGGLTTPLHYNILRHCQDSIGEAKFSFSNLFKSTYSLYLMKNMPSIKIGGL